MRCQVLSCLWISIDTKRCLTGGRHASGAHSLRGLPLCAHQAAPGSTSTSAVQEGEELFTCQWTQDEVSGAPLLLLAGKLGCLSVINCATKQLEWVGHFDYSSPGSTHALVGEGPALLMHDTNVPDVQGLA